MSQYDLGRVIKKILKLTLMCHHFIRLELSRDSVEFVIMHRVNLFAFWQTTVTIISGPLKLGNSIITLKRFDQLVIFHKTSDVIKVLCRLSGRWLSSNSFPFVVSLE